MVGEVCLQLGDRLERHRVPEPAPAPREEEPPPEDLADRAIGDLIITLGLALRPDRSNDGPARSRGANARR